MSTLCFLLGAGINFLLIISTYRSVLIVTGRPRSSSKKMISLRPMAHHTVTFDTEGANYMLVKLGLCLTSHILLINVSTEVEMCFTEKDQVQQSRVVFNALSDVNTKGSSLFLICCSLSLQNQNFVGKQMKISVHYSSNGCP